MPSRFGKVYAKKLYLPDGKDKGQNNKMTRVTATPTELNAISGGTVVADLTGNVTGNVTGDITGDVTNVVTTISDDVDMADTDFATTLITLVGDGTCDVTNWTPVVGRTYTLYCPDSTVDPTVTLSAGIVVNAAANNKMTFLNPGDAIVLQSVSATKMIVVANVSAVQLDSV